MFQSENLRPIVLSLTAIGMWLLSTGGAQAQMKCYYNPDVQCQACSGKIGDQCCWNYACADGTSDSSCSSCSQANMQSHKRYILVRKLNEGGLRKSDEAILLSRLLARDRELEYALRELR
jgi:hypothetical protein